MNPKYHKDCDELIEEWYKFKWALRGDDKERFKELMNMVRRHKAAVNDGDYPTPMEKFLMSIILEQQIKIDRLERVLDNRGKDVEKW